MDREFASSANQLAIDALERLHRIVKLCPQEYWKLEENLEMYRSIGKLIGNIDYYILCEIYKYYPDLDTLKE